MKYTLALLIALLTTGSVFAQDEEKDPAVSLNADLSAGVGFYDTVAAVFQLDVVGWDFMEATSGLGVEIDIDNDAQYSWWMLNRVNIPKTFDRLYAGVDMKFAQSYLRSSPQTHIHHDHHVHHIHLHPHPPISLPSTELEHGRTDPRPEWPDADIEQQTSRSVEWDIDFRFVAGVRVHDIGPINLKIEAYFAEYDRPVTVALLVSF